MGSGMGRDGDAATRRRGREGDLDRSVTPRGRTGKLTAQLQTAADIINLAAWVAYIGGRMDTTFALVPMGRISALEIQCAGMNDILAHDHAIAEPRLILPT